MAADGRSTWSIDRMPPRSKSAWGAWLSAAAIFIALALALALAANPELRALLLLTDALGFELVAILFATQFRSFLYAVLPASKLLVRDLCRLASSVGAAAVRSYPKEVACRPFDGAWCLILVVASYGLRCGIQS